jgi:hypothetical protein
LSGKYDQEVSDLFELRNRDNTRGHRYKIYKNRSRLNIRKNSFCNVIVNIWNSLPTSVVESKNLQTFERRLDRYWENQEQLYEYKAEITTGPDSIDTDSENEELVLEATNSLHQNRICEYIESTLLSANDFWMKGAASCIRHEEDKKKSRFWTWLFPISFGYKFSIWVKNSFLSNSFFFGNERRSVPSLQLHLGDIAYQFVLFLFYFILLVQSLDVHILFSFWNKKICVFR